LLFARAYSWRECELWGRTWTWSKMKTDLVSHEVFWMRIFIWGAIVPNKKARDGAVRVKRMLLF
jgi:hypothetical protein